jgi:hypothetical protein
MARKRGAADCDIMVSIGVLVLGVGVGSAQSERAGADWVGSIGSRAHGGVRPEQDWPAASRIKGGLSEGRSVVGRGGGRLGRHDAKDAEGRA